MKTWMKRLVIVLVVVMITFGWVLYFHNAAVAAKLPKWGWLQATVTAMGVLTAALIAARPSTLSGQHGSSRKYRT